MISDVYLKYYQHIKQRSPKLFWDIIDSFRPRARLLEAASEGQREECVNLLAHGSDVNAVDELGWTALMHAARNGHLDSFRPRARLLEAAAEGQREECVNLLAHGSDVNAVDELGWTALMHAARNGHCGVVRDLLAHGAEVSLRNHHGVTAFTLAVLRCEDAILHTLYDRLMPADLKQEESNMALQVACVRGLYAPLKWLLANSCAQINCVSNVTSATPLVLAVMGHYHRLVEVLLKSNADTTIATALGQDSSHLAAVSNDDKLFNLLHLNTSPAKSMFFNFNKTNKSQIELIDPGYTLNNIYLDLPGDVVLKNAPNRPVFKTCDDDYDPESRDDGGVKSMLSPSLRSVFLPSPQQERSPLTLSWDSNRFHCDYSLNGLISPRPGQLQSTLKSPGKSPNRRKKRKLCYKVGSWFKQLTKRRTRSLDEAPILEGSRDCVSFNKENQNGIDFTQLLNGMGLDDFFPIFKEQELDIWTFLTLTAEDLDAMEIHDQASQEHILKSIKMLRKTQF